jgi:hypothetical protein
MQIKMMVLFRLIEDIMAVILPFIPVGGTPTGTIKIKLTPMMKIAARVIEKYKFNNANRKLCYATTCK